MATTTNYGWTTPDDTALVKDGAAAIRSLGTAIDTTTKNLNPSTTLGDIEYRSSTSNTNTRLPIGTSGQGLRVVSGVPAWAETSTSTLTATGDLLYASAANTLARRAIGTTGQVLTVSGGLPTWATPAAGGKVLQVVYGSTSTGVSNSTSTAADTGLTATITPSAATSKILVLVSQNGVQKSAANSSNGIEIRVLRGATQIGRLSQYGNYTASALLVRQSGTSCAILDNPASTSALTYKTTFLNPNNTASVSVQEDSDLSTIVLMEIGA